MIKEYDRIIDGIHEKNEVLEKALQIATD